MASLPSSVQRPSSKESKRPKSSSNSSNDGKQLRKDEKTNRKGNEIVGNSDGVDEDTLVSKSNSTSLPELNTKHTNSNSNTSSKKSPLASGDYEKQLLLKLNDLHREGYTPKLLNNNKKKEAPESTKQLKTVNTTLTRTKSLNPPMERANKIDQKYVFIYRLLYKGFCCCL